ncbi:MAG TPA: TPM domain-containing protein [Rudaea sp.]|nr:TPM domain-containing protein [Rudaea sp.]
MEIGRILRHVLAEGSARRHFPDTVLDAIQHAVAAGERRHQEQVCFVAEGALEFAALWKRTTPRQRAQEVFSHLRVWDTQQNSGVLIYVLLADHAIEIVADRGIAAKVDAEQWQSICTQIQKRFVAGEFEQGAIESVTAVSDVLTLHFPRNADSPDANELPDRPVLL